MTPADLPTRIANKITVDAATGCWLWRGARSSAGYGHVRWEGRYAQAHRVVRHLLVGDGVAIFPGRDGDPCDHLCRVRSCVRPDHVETVTQRTNCNRGARGVLNPTRTSRYFGVFRQTGSSKWTAKIMLDGERQYLGRFADEVDAARRVDEACALNGVTPPNVALLAEATP